VQWLLAIPHLMIAYALRTLRQVLTLLSLFTVLRLAYPAHLWRWHPRYKWFLAIPQYVVVAVLAIAAALGIIAGFFAVLFTGRYPQGIRDGLVSSYRYALRVEAYAGFLTDRYSPFSLAA
jgi:hypothetical protein